VYNEECSPIITEPNEITGWIDGDISTLKAEVRTRDNSFGQLVAEAYYNAFKSSPARLQPDVAMQNAGSIRSEGVCVPREIVKAGAVRRSVLREVMPFDNGVIVVSVTHRQLKSILERSLVALLDENGAFMQIYGLVVEAECYRADAGEQLIAVTAITLGVKDASMEPLDGSEPRRIEFDEDNPPSDEETVRLAVNDYIGKGNDGYTDLKVENRVPGEVLEAGGYDFEIIASYFRKTYSDKEHALPAKAAERWVLTNCR